MEHTKKGLCLLISGIIVSIGFMIITNTNLNNIIWFAGFILIITGAFGVIKLMP